MKSTKELLEKEYFGRNIIFADDLDSGRTPEELIQRYNDIQDACGEAMRNQEKGIYWMRDKGTEWEKADFDPMPVTINLTRLELEILLNYYEGFGTHSTDFLFPTVIANLIRDVEQLTKKGKHTDGMNNDRERINQRIKRLESEIDLIYQAEEEAKKDHIEPNGFFNLWIQMETRKRYDEIRKLRDKELKILKNWRPGK